jgi:hypothetical protein
LSEMPKFELVAKCGKCGKEIVTDLDMSNAMQMFTFRLASHLFQFGKHWFKVSMKVDGVPKSVNNDVNDIRDQQ